MILLGAMAIGALIGAVAGVAVYGVKTAISKKTKWSWKAAAAHAVGGLVGGGLFPAILAGLAAVGLPVAGAYVLAGGLAWGGLWTLAQDAASWGLGLEDGLRSPSRYLVATGIGLLATAALMPFAARAIGNSGLIRHAGTVESFVTPSARHVPASILKSEAEFLAFGAMVEVADNGLNRAANELVDSITESSADDYAAAEKAVADQDAREKARAAAPSYGPLAALANEVNEVDPAYPLSPFGQFLEREGIQPPLATIPLLPQPALPQRAGLAQQLRAIGAASDR